MAAASEDARTADEKISPEETISEVSEKNRFIKLTDLKVAELKCELEKRDLDKNGVKSVLIERLRNALLEEGKDPETFNFINLNDAPKSKSLQINNPGSETNGELDESSKNAEFSCESINVSNSDLNEPANAEVKKSVHTVLNENSEIEIPPQDTKVNESLNLKTNKCDSELNKLGDPEQNEVTCSEENGMDGSEENGVDGSEENGVDGSEEKEVADSEENVADSEDFQSIALEKFKVIDSAENESDDSEENRLVDTDSNGLIQIEKLKSDNFRENEYISEENPSVDLTANNSTDDVNNSEELEINNAEYLELSSSEDKMNCEVTLQLSIDEEEAQLNEDENIIEIPKSVEETVLKSEEVNKCNLDTSCDTITAESSNQTSPLKAKSVSEESKDRKIAKTPINPKPFESTVSPRVLKVIGKNDKMKNANVLAKSLWVTSLPTTTRAADLKALFSKQGRVLSVKIVKSTKQTPGKCYSFVTMANSNDATKAIQNLHCTEFNGRTISVERTQSEPNALLKNSEAKLTTEAKKQSGKKEIVKAESAKLSVNSESKASSKQDTKSTEKKIEEKTEVKEDKRKSSEKGKSKEKDHKSRDVKERDSRRPLRRPPAHRNRPFSFSDRPRFGTFGRHFAQNSYASRSGVGAMGFRPRSGTSLYEKIREERMRQRDRFRERGRRELERRRAIEISHQRHIERKQREEAYRLEREKEKLRIERELLERERAEMLKFEREKQLLERARLEREREVLRRQAELRRSIKRPRVVREADAFWDEKKKSRYEERSTFHGDKLREIPSSTSRYEFPTRESSRSIGRHDYERHPERFSSSKAFGSSARSNFSERNIRREVSIRSRDERQVFERSDDRDHRRSIGSRERHSSSRRETPRSMDWKHERRVHEKVVISRNSGQRRMTYY